MSGDAREWVWENSTSRGTARLILLSIADRVTDDQYIAWASLTSLAQRAHASRSTVREALDRLLASGELEQLEDLTGPQRSTVYLLPLAAKGAAQRASEHEGHGRAPAGEAGLTYQMPALRRCGIRAREVPESPATVRKPAGPETGTSRQKPVPRRAGFRHNEVPETGTQNRSEPDLNRRYSRSGAGGIFAGDWRVDPDTHTWVREQGHLDRLGEEGLAAADTKWRSYRAGWKARPAAAWAADWRSWVAREHAPGRPNLHALPSNGTGATAGQPGGMTRTEAHTAALLAALDAPTETE